MYVHDRIYTNLTINVMTHVIVTYIHIPNIHVLISCIFELQLF